MKEKISKTEQSFFALLRAGLWEKEVRLAPYGEIDFSAVLDLAEEQSVVGLVAAGIEHISDGKLQKKDVLQFIGRTVQLEQRNQAMNYFIGVLVEKIPARYDYSRRQLMGTTKIPSSRRYSEPRAVSTIRNEGEGSELLPAIFSFSSMSE